jgi:cation transport regulator ChaB
MPYAKGETPGGTERVPAHGQAIYRAAFNAAYKQYGEERAHAIAWSAVKKKYRKKGNEWVSKDGERAMRAFGDKEFSTERRETLAKKGKAMPGGGYPIENEGDLKNAIQAFGRAKNKAATKAWIKKRARALGKTELLPENWDSVPAWASLKVRDAWLAADMKVCPKCGGSGKDIGDRTCPRCDGEGYVADAKKPDDDDDDEDDDDDTKDAKNNNGNGDDDDDDDDDDGDDDDTKDARSVHLIDRNVQLIDTPTRRTKDGYLVCSARIARTGIQLYAGDELGIPDEPIVRVYRPPEEVFSKASMHSMAHLPITLDHPDTMVDADNWRQHAIGHIGEEVSRDGDCLRVPLIIMDSKAIEAYEKHGVKQLSVGYGCDLKWNAGVTPDGETYDAKQTAIRGNHLAVVPAARGGSRLCIGDDHHQKGEADMVKILIDGQTIEFADELAAKHVQGFISKLQQQLADANNKASTEEAEKEQEEEKKTRAESDAASKNGEIAALKKQLDDANARLTGKAFDEAVKERIDLLTKANAVMEGKVSFDGKEPAEIKRMVVEAKLGDGAKGLSDAEINGAFKWASASVTVTPARGTERLADDLSLLSFGGGTRHDPQAIKDAAYEKYCNSLGTAWKSHRAAAAR